MPTPDPTKARRASIPRLLIIAVGILSFAVGQAQTLLSHYTLDGTTADTGSIGINGTLNGDAAFSTAGTGVGNFSQALATGQNDTNDYLVVSGSANNANYALDAITISLWVNLTSGANTDRLVSNITGSSGFDLLLNNFGTPTTTSGEYNLSFGFNSTSGAVQSASPLYVTGKWLFVAVTYDSSLGSDNVIFYSGDETTGVSLNDTETKSVSIVSSSSNLEIGGTPATGNDRSPDALFNDVRIYNGVLNLAQLEALRNGAIAVPEPSGAAWLAGLCAIGFLGFKRLRQR